MVTFNDITLSFNGVARVLCDQQHGNAFATTFSKMFQHVTNRHPSFKNGESLCQIMVDFDQAEYNGFERAIGADLTKQLLQGCSLHWKKSINKVNSIIMKITEGTDAFQVSFMPQMVGVL